jgi:DNA-binding transcriptional ArsR family regulator
MLKIFVDLDSTLTDFPAAVKAIGAESGLIEETPEEDKTRMYKAIDEAGEEFWSAMSWMPEGRELWALLEPYHPVLLSSPGQFRDAPAGKQTWVNNNLPGVTLICDPDKYQYAERNAILIDDMQDNVGAWQEAGGIGILHTSFEDTKARLLAILNEPKMKATLADQIRKVAFELLLNPLKSSLKEVMGYLDKDTPIDIKTSVNRMVREILSSDQLEKIHEIIKASIKGLKNLKRKEMLRFLILQPVQVALGKIKPTDVNFHERLKYLTDLKKIEKDETTRQEYAEKFQEKGLTKGVPHSQVKPHSQRLYVADLIHTLLTYFKSPFDKHV